MLQRLNWSKINKNRFCVTIIEQLIRFKAPKIVIGIKKELYAMLCGDKWRVSPPLCPPPTNLTTYVFVCDDPLQNRDYTYTFSTRISAFLFFPLFNSTSSFRSFCMNHNTMCHFVAHRCRCICERARTEKFRRIGLPVVVSKLVRLDLIQIGKLVFGRWYSRIRARILYVHAKTLIVPRMKKKRRLSF